MANGRRLALNKRSALDPRWTIHNRAILDSFALATIEIHDINESATSYDISTNAWTVSNTPLWTGKARIQGKPNAKSGTGSTSLQREYDPGVPQIVEVHIGLRENQLVGSNGIMPNLRPGNRMRVTASPVDPQLINFDFVVRSVINSSNPWHRMLLCEINQELNPNG